MIEPAPLQRLLTWLSPAFPVGAFAWSAGLETAIADGRVRDAAALKDWIAGQLAHGALRTDAIILAHAWRAARTASLPAPAGGAAQESTYGLRSVPSASENGAGGWDDGLTALAELCLALTPTAERHRETLATGDAFIVAARTWPSDIYERLPDPCPYPIAVGAVAGAHGVGLDETLLAHLTAALQGQVSVAVRLVPLGQTDGLAVLAALEPQAAALARHAATATLDDIGGIAYSADIAQMRHETLEPRIFRS